MKRLLVTPDGWPCSLEECPPGLFVYNSLLCFKSEYGDPPYIVESGEYFRTDIPEKQRGGLEVQPCIYEWVEE